MTSPDTQPRRYCVAFDKHTGQYVALEETDWREPNHGPRVASGLSQSAAVAAAGRRNEDAHKATELELFIRNDGGLYRSLTAPLWVKTAHLIAAGTYDPDAALRACRNVADQGAKEYRAKHGKMTDEWHRLFPVAMRDEVARRLRHYVETEIRLGNHPDMDRKEAR